MSTDNGSTPLPTKNKIGPVAGGLISSILYLSLLCVVLKLVGCSVASVREIGHGKITEAQLQRCPIDGSCPVEPNPPIQKPVIIKAPSGDVKPWESAVRIRIRSKESISTGSGTIVLGNADRSIVLTCAHLFRDKSGYGSPKSFRLPIYVDLFNGAFKAEYLETFIGSCLDFDAGRDVALIEFSPKRTLRASLVALTDWAPTLGERYLAVGCTLANLPTVWAVANVGSFGPVIGKYRAIETTQPPIEGRSGGGLHLASDGRLVGVCTGHADGKGLYAETASIRRILETNGLSELTTSTPEERRPRANIEPPTSIDSTVPPSSGRVLGLQLSNGLDLFHLLAGMVCGFAVTGLLKRFAISRLTTTPLIEQLDTRMHHVIVPEPSIKPAVDPITQLLIQLQANKTAREIEATQRAKAQELLDLGNKIKAVVDPTSTANADGK